MSLANEAVSNTCEICTRTVDKNLHCATEMMYGLGGEFAYEECTSCGCVSIVDTPESLDQYYPADYYSFAPKQQTKNNALVNFLKKQRSKHLLGERNLLGSLLASASSVPYYTERIKRANITLNSRLLDVGCGAGTMLCDMRNDGYENLTGLDPFIAEDIHYPHGVNILKRNMSELDQQFDCLFSHHSFEHMPEPEETFDNFNRLLVSGGKLVLSIPLAGSHAWKTYGVNWVNLDAPRHLYLHTPKSIELLATRHGFKLGEVLFDSSAQQFWASEQYAKGIHLRGKQSYSSNPEASLFTADDIEKFGQQAAELNRKGEGDMATFYFTKS